MTPTKSQQAQEYAKQIQKDFIHNRLVTEELAFEDIEAAWLAGYTACEQSMWRNVEEELPSNDHDVVASDENGLHIASYFNGEWYSCDDEFTRNPQMWMPIPSPPDTNTEKI